MLRTEILSFGENTPGLLGWLVNSELGERSPRRDLNPERPDTGRVSMFFTVRKKLYFMELQVDKIRWNKMDGKN